MNEDSVQRRREVWIALSDLWLDTELEDSRLDEIAAIVRASGFSHQEMRSIFRYELAPFLGLNQLNVAGEWAGFDPQWVCEEAAKRVGAPGFVKRLLIGTGIMTYAAKDAWRQVLQRAFGRAS